MTGEIWLALVIAVLFFAAAASCSWRVRPDVPHDRADQVPPSSWSNVLLVLDGKVGPDTQILPCQKASHLAT